ncbi:MAG: hypothetical protein O9272_10535 [Brevundimonas sp.]|nr:hypothetical protein [Brevundimonas sp.]
MIATLQQALADAEHRLTQGARDRRSPMHMPVVGTADGDLRMMVLRDCSPGLSLLRFHTDARSPKVTTVAAGGLVSVLGFDPQDKVQVRVRGPGRIETTGLLAEAAWGAATALARRCYLAVDAPGTPVEEAQSGLPPEVEGLRPTEVQLIPAREHFAVLLIEPTSLDWLHLAQGGHRRALFTSGAPGDDWNVGSFIP